MKGETKMTTVKIGPSIRLACNEHVADRAENRGGFVDVEDFALTFGYLANHQCPQLGQLISRVNQSVNLFPKRGEVVEVIVKIADWAIPVYDNDDIDEKPMTTYVVMAFGGGKAAVRTLITEEYMSHVYSGYGVPTLYVHEGAMLFTVDNNTLTKGIPEAQTRDLGHTVIRVA